MIKHLNVVQHNECDIFLVHSALDLLPIALVTVLLIILSSPVLHSLIFVLALSYTHTHLSLSSSSISISVYILIWCNTFSSNSLTKSTWEKIDNLHICMFYYSLLHCQGLRGTWPLFPRHSQMEITLGLFSGWTTFHVNWFGVAS